MKMKVFSLLAAVLFGLAANAETKEIIWDSSTIQSISLGRSFLENGDSASIVTAKDGIYLKIEALRGTKIDFYGRGIYTNGKVFFTPSEGKLTQVVFNASKENNLDGWTTRGTQLVWTGNADRAYINNSTSSVSVEGIQSISFMVEAEEKTDTISPSAGVEVNEVNFPDASFRRWIQGQSYGSDLMLTDEEIALVKSINVMDKSITSLKGIEFFTEPENSFSNYWLNVVILPDHDKQLEFLQETNDKGVMTRPIWELMNRLPMFENCENDGLKNTIFFADRVVNIPSSVRLKLYRNEIEGITNY